MDVVKISKTTPTREIDCRCPVNCGCVHREHTGQLIYVFDLRLSDLVVRDVLDRAMNDVVDICKLRKDGE